MSKWQINKPINFLRSLLNEYHKLSVLRSLTSLSQLNLNAINNNTTNKLKISSIKNNTSTCPSSQNLPLQLVTAFSGFSKENFSKRRIPILNKNSYIFGDDALFTASKKCADIMGVADGVGGWREMGVDPSKFSSSLMKQCKRLVEQENEIFSNSKNINSQTPLDILINSYNALLENKEPNLFGSSTACIIVFNRESKYLYSANLGDSGFVIIRNNKIVHRSQEQYHYFNAPFQMAILPYMSSGYFNDNPKSASVSSFELAEGDFIVMATDGLWDNLSENALLLKISDIKVMKRKYFLKTLLSFIQTNFIVFIKNYSLQDLENAAKNISSYAAELSKDPNYMSPFAISAKKYGFDFEGIV
jgi:protein phosphatase PTC7